MGAYALRHVERSFKLRDTAFKPSLCDIVPKVNLPRSFLGRQLQSDVAEARSADALRFCSVWALSSMSHAAMISSSVGWYFRSM